MHDTLCKSFCISRTIYHMCHISISGCLVLESLEIMDLGSKKMLAFLTEENKTIQWMIFMNMNNLNIR